MRCFSIDKLHLLQDKAFVKKISDALFFVALTIELAIVLIDKSSVVNSYEGRLFQITFILFFAKFLLTKYDYKEYLITLVYLILVGLVYYFGKQNFLIRAVIFVASCKDINMQKYLRYAFWFTAIGCIAIAVLSCFGIGGDLTILKEYPGEVFERRYCFGMGNANSFHTMFFACCLLGIYVYRDRMRTWIVGCLILADIGLFMLTDSRTSFAITLISLLLILFTVKYLEKPLAGKVQTLFGKIFGLGCIVISALALCFSVWCAYMAKYVGWWLHYEPGAMQWVDRPQYLVDLDRILTGRIRCLVETNPYKGAIESWTIFPDSLNKDTYFDMGIIRVFYWYGILAAIAIIVVVSVLIMYFYKKRLYTELAFVTIIIVYTVVEAHFVSNYIGRNYILFMLGMYLPKLFARTKNKDEIAQG